MKKKKQKNKTRRHANHRNAQKSTGPKTPHGKAISSRNAIKHGLYARDIILNTNTIKENPREYIMLSESVFHDLRPQGIFQEVLVRRIINCLWRSQRAITAETAHITQQMEKAEEMTAEDFLACVNKVREEEFYGSKYDKGYDLGPGYPPRPQQKPKTENPDEPDFCDQLRLRRVGPQMLPDPTFLNSIIRYEAHLNRQLTQAFKLLEHLQQNAPCDQPDLTLADIPPGLSRETNPIPHNSMPDNQMQRNIDQSLDDSVTHSSLWDCPPGQKGNSPTSRETNPFPYNPHLINILQTLSALAILPHTTFPLKSFHDSIILSNMLSITENMLQLHNRDCISGMKELLPEKSIDVVVTSPPYNIGVQYAAMGPQRSSHEFFDDCIPRDKYLEWITQWGKAVKKVLKDSGSLFLNIGAKPTSPNVPFQVLEALSGDFVLQNAIHWIKSIYIESASYGRELNINVGHYKPINSQRFLNDNHEYVFHLTKDGRVPLDRLAIGVPYKDRSNISRWKSAHNRRHCRGNVWFIPYKTIRNRQTDRPHPASFPPLLAENCIKLHGLKKDLVVLDPFMGIGNTALACKTLNVKFVGFEIDTYYFKEACDRLQNSEAIINA